MGNTNLIQAYSRDLKTRYAMFEGAQTNSTCKFPFFLLFNFIFSIGKGGALTQLKEIPDLNLLVSLNQCQIQGFCFEVFDVSVPSKAKSIFHSVKTEMAGIHPVFLL